MRAGALDGADGPCEAGMCAEDMVGIIDSVRRHLMAGVRHVTIHVPSTTYGKLHQIDAALQLVSARFADVCLEAQQNLAKCGCGKCEQCGKRSMTAHLRKSACSQLAWAGES